MICYLLTLPFAVSAAEMSPPLDRLLAAEPTGRYVGDKDVLGKHIHAVMTYNDADGTMDFQLSGVLAVDCPGEPFTMSDGEVSLSNVDNDSDCIKSTLENNHCKLKTIDYDAESDTLDVKVDYHWLGVHVHLSKVPSETLTASGACMDATDQKLWNSDGRATFSADLSKCGHKCWGGADCTGKCINEDFGYTTPCATCFGELTGCTKHHCMWDCSHDASGPKCKNCVDEHCTPAFKSCSGLTPPSNTALETASGACMDEKDQNLWTNNGRTSFSADLSKCGHKCLGFSGCTGKCIKDDFGYTTPCATCFGSLTGCTKDHCMWDCSHDASGPKCKNCVDEHCTPAFESCSGLTPPSNTVLELSVPSADCTDLCESLFGQNCQHATGDCGDELEACSIGCSNKDANDHLAAPQFE